jgi:hypothetical protein
MFENIIDKYFGFLERDFGFKKIPEYNYVREIHNDYIKNNLIIKIIFEGSYIVDLMKAKFADNDLFDGNKKTIDYDYSFFKYYNLNQFTGNKKTNISLQKKHDSENDLLYCSEILKNNPEILNGSTFKFSFIYRILKKFEIKKRKTAANKG